MSPIRRLLVIEDGAEYAEFARVFFAALEVLEARSSVEALAHAASADAFLIDLRFERAAPETLTGDLDATAARLFAGDRVRALRHLQDQQGALILGELRAHGHAQPGLFVQEFPPRRLHNLRRLYGDVRAVPSFDAAAMRRALELS